MARFKSACRGLRGLAFASLRAVTIKPWLSVGAWFFVASDLLLAFETFGGGTPLGNLPIWPTYWIAQALLTWAWLQSEDRSS